MVSTTFQDSTVLLIFLFVFVRISSTETQIAAQNNTKISSPLRPPHRLVAPTQPIKGDHISLEFYGAMKSAERSKNRLQATLYNFPENLQRNLTTSTILKTVINIIDVAKTQHQLRKVNDLLVFFRAASESAKTFASESENLFEITKNESNALLLKLRQLPTEQRNLPVHVISQLTDYFAEMEFFHIMFCEIVDQALEYIVDTMYSMQRTFSRYADIQNDLLYKWNFKRDEWCCSRYMDFLQHWSVQIFQCITGEKLAVAYDVYAMTEVTTMYLLQQLEFRIQRLFNCFLSGGYEIRCRFLKEPELDFEKLHAKLEELQIYYDIKIKRGRVTTFRHRERRSRREEEKMVNELDSQERNEEEGEANDTRYKCIPRGFPRVQMTGGLQSCFYFHQINE